MMHCGILFNMPYCIVFPSCRPEEGCDELLAKTLEKVTAAQLFDYLINNKVTGKIESGHIIGCDLLYN